MLPQALKLKVIQQYEAGKLQKDIAHDLGISTGSVSTILKASKDKQKNEVSIPREQPRDTVQIISQQGPLSAGIEQIESVLQQDKKSPLNSSSIMGKIKHCHHNHHPQMQV